MAAENSQVGDDLNALVDALGEDRSHFEIRFIRRLADVSRVTEEIRRRGRKVVLTSGSFDVIHEGHSMYLEAARSLGDFLVVGVDSDEKVRARKGRGRPAVPEGERLRMVTHQRGVGLVTLKDVDHPRWALIKAVRPDVLVATEDSYTPEQIAQLESGYCGRVEVLHRMATISTSARLRTTYFEITNRVEERLPGFLQATSTEFASRMQDALQDLVRTTSLEIARRSEERLQQLLREVVAEAVGSR